MKEPKPRNDLRGLVFGNLTVLEIAGHNGEKLTISQFSDLIQRPYSAVYQELTKLNWTPEKCAAKAVAS